MNDHEHALLSIIAQNPDWTRKHASQLSPILFDSEPCRLIYEAITECGSQWDATTITATLRRRNLLDKVGGPAGVSEYWMTFPIASMATHHLQAVRDATALRRALQAHKEAQTKLEAALTQGTADAAGLLSTIREELDSAAKLPGKRLNRLSAAEAMQLVVDRIEERAANPGKIAGLSTGFELLDKFTHGLQAGHVWVFAGGPGDGKSSMMQNVLEAAAQNARTAVYQLEMSIEEQAMRFLASDAQVDSGSILKGYMTEAEKVALAAGFKRLKKAGTDFVDTDGATAADIIGDIESGDYRVVMVDYLQLMEIEASKGENREQAVSRIAKDLKNVAKRKKCTILTGSQLNDDGKLRESRAIGQHADKVALVRRWEAEGEPDMTRRLLVLEKNRGGPPLEKIPLRFNGASFRFSESTEDDEPDWTSGMKPTTKRRR
jgi:replicative DNA helicase